MNQWSVIGLVVQVIPKDMASLLVGLTMLPGTEVVAKEMLRGTVAVVMQGECPKKLLTQMESVRALPGVLAVSLVYQQQDDEQKEVTA